MGFTDVNNRKMEEYFFLYLATLNVVSTSEHKTGMEKDAGVEGFMRLSLSGIGCALSDGGRK